MSLDHPTMSLDHRFFPHILDKIFAFAPYESLLVLRCASRGLKNRVDKRMLHHVAVFSSATSKHELFFWEPEGKRLPCMMEWNEHGQRKHGLDDAGEDHAGHDNGDEKHHAHSNDDAWLLNTEELLREVRILDIHGDLDGKYTAFLKTLPMRVLRCIAHKERVGSSNFDGLVVPTVVLFVNWVCEDKDYAGISGDIPSDATRVVVNIGKPNNARCDWKVVGLPFLPGAVKELVVIFQSLRHFNDPRPKHVQDFVGSDFFEDIIWVIVKVRVTFVDIHVVAPEFLGLEPASFSAEEQAGDNPNTRKTQSVSGSTTEVMVMPVGSDRHATAFTIENAIRRCMNQQNRYTSPEILSRSVRDNVRFLTIDEYRNEIGKEQFQLEMVPSVASADMVHPDEESE